MHFQDQNQDPILINIYEIPERINEFLLMQRTSINIKNAIFTVSLKSNLI